MLLKFTNPVEFKYLLGVSNTKHTFCEIFISMFIVRVDPFAESLLQIQGNVPMLFVLIVVI